MDLQPVIADYYNSARVYFFSVFGLIILESLVKLPAYLFILSKRGRPVIKSSSGTHSAIRVFFHKLVTLPSPFPSVITDHNYPDLLRLAAIVGLNILFGWNRIRFSTDYNLYGWLTIANGGLAILFGARNNLFYVLLRIPSSTLLMYHRWVGRATVVHATLHFALNVQRFIKTKQLDTVITNTRIQVGLMAWVALALIYVTSVNFIRRKFFEAFYYPHFLFIVFVIGALIHASHGPEFLIPGLALWVVDRAIRFAYNFRSIRVNSVMQYTGDLTKFKFEGLKTTHPGQIAWINIPGASWLNWHPFTIASAPGENQATIAVRGLGGYTRKLHAYSASPQSDPEKNSLTTSIRLRVDGPYGVASVNYGIHPTTIIVAGGIGITPGISIASHILKRATSPDVEPNGKRWSVHLLWVVRSLEHAQWFNEELSSLATLAENPAVPATFDVAIYVTDGSASSAVGSVGSSGETNSVGVKRGGNYAGPGVVTSGRPDIERWFQSVRTAHPGEDAVVNACGPRSLVNATRRAAANASGRDGIFYVDEESFER